MKSLPFFLLMLLVMTLPACAETIETKAQTQAQKDIQAGKPEYRIYGEPTSREDILAGILKTQYGVVLHRVAGCVVTSELCKETEAYNTTVAAYLEKLHHKDVFAAAEAEFRVQWEKASTTPVKAVPPEKALNGKSR